jgi:hypothetical protein
MMTISIPDSISDRLKFDADCHGMDFTMRIIQILTRAIPAEADFNSNSINIGLERTQYLLSKIPCISDVVVSSTSEKPWQLRLVIDIESNVAWTTIHELSYILNSLATEERLPTCFYPVICRSSNHHEQICWIIEPTDPYFDPNVLYEFLNGMLSHDYWVEKNY